MVVSEGTVGPLNRTDLRVERKAHLGNQTARLSHWDRAAAG